MWAAIREMFDIYEHYTKNPDEVIMTERDMAIVMIDRVREILDEVESSNEFHS